MTFTKSDKRLLKAAGIASDETPFVVSRPDGTVRILQELGVPVTRESYLKLAFAGNPPVELDGEIEAYLDHILARGEE